MPSGFQGDPNQILLVQGNLAAFEVGPLGALHFCHEGSTTLTEATPTLRHTCPFLSWHHLTPLGSHPLKFLDGIPPNPEPRQSLGSPLRARPRGSAPRRPRPSPPLSPPLPVRPAAGAVPAPDAPSSVRATDRARLRAARRLHRREPGAAGEVGALSHRALRRALLLAGRDEHR